MFFAAPGVYEPCKMYTKGHLILFVSTFISIICLLKCTWKYNKDQVKKIIKTATITLWILEIIKIVFNFLVGNGSNPNHYLPLYYCSIILFAGAFSSFSKGTLKRIGDIFIATGSIIGGVFFLCCPNTSIAMYPMFHYISIQSFIFHGTMVYLGILVNITNYVEWNYKDIKYYAAMLMAMLLCSYWVNNMLGTNFMFISQNFPGTPVDLIYKTTGRYFTIVMSALQLTLPFIWVHMGRGIVRWINKMISKSRNSGNRIESIEKASDSENNTNEEPSKDIISV